MAKATFSSSPGRTVFLTIGAFLLILGAGAAGFSRVENQILEGVGTTESNPLHLTSLPDTASPLSNLHGLESDSRCRRSAPLVSFPGATGRQVVNQDQRRYLSKMASLPYQRRGATASALDPYQVSLNPSVYLVNDAALPTVDVGSTRVALSQTCHVP